MLFHLDLGMFFVFLFYWFGGHRDLHSFPTRRSSDLYSIRDLLTSPNHSQGYTLGLEWATPAVRGRDLLRFQARSEEHTSELQSLRHLVCRLLLEKKKKAHNKALHIERPTTRTGSPQ